MADRFHAEITFPRSAFGHESLRGHVIDLIGIKDSDFDTNDEIDKPDCPIDSV